MPVDVRARVRLCVAEPLRVREHVGEPPTLLGHLRQDEVGRAVDDPHHPAEPLTGQRLLERPDQRDPSAHRRLEVQVEPLGVGRVEELAPARREQFLVGRDDGLVAFERGQDQGPCGFEPTDQLADDVDVGIVDHGHRVLDERRRREPDVPGLRGVADGHPAHLEPAPRAALDVVAVAFEQPDDRGADGAAAQHPDPQDPLAHVTPASLASVCRPARSEPHMTSVRSIDSGADTPRSSSRFAIVRLVPRQSHRRAWVSSASSERTGHSV